MKAQVSRGPVAIEPAAGRALHGRPGDRPTRGATTAAGGPRAVSLDASPRQLLQRRRIDGLFGGGASRDVVQRNDESAATLKRLATLAPFAGPEIKAQMDIVAALEKLMEPLAVGDDKIKYNVTCVGAIELPVDLNGKTDDLIKRCKLVDLPDNAVRHSTFDLVQKAGVAEQIVLNTIRTMDAAGQLDYLRQSGVADKAWKILVEVHYYRDRDPGQTKFHKDTRGQTLFVNLNFTNDQDIAGPELLLNPARVDAHEDYVSKTLPKTFRDDLAAVREQLKAPDTVTATQVPPHGVVAFVDELLHHKTPTYGHRKASPGALRFYLEKTYGAEFDQAQAAYGKHFGAVVRFKSWESTLGTVKQLSAKQWKRLLRLANSKDPQQALDRPTLAKAGLDTQGIETILATSTSDFSEVSLPHTKQTNIPVQENGKPPLKRQMSDLALADKLPPPVVGKRRFFRTWVRAVPREG